MLDMSAFGIAKGVAELWGVMQRLPSASGSSTAAAVTKCCSALPGTAQPRQLAGRSRRRLLLGFSMLGLLLWEGSQLWRPVNAAAGLRRRLLHGGGGESDFVMPGAVPGVVIVDNRAHAGKGSAAAEEAGSEADQQLGSIAGLERQPPYFMLMTFTAVSALIQVLIFGPPSLEGGGDDGLVITVLQHWSVVIFLKTLLTDFVAVIMVLFSGRTMSEGMGGLILVAATSPNVAVGIMMSALGSLYENAGFWRKAHRNEDMPSLDEAMLSKGSAFWAYYLLTKFCGAVPGALATLYCVPAFIAYFWLLLPLGALLFLICKKILPPCTACCSGHVACTDPAMLSVLSGQTSSEGFSDLLNAADTPYNPYEAVHEGSPQPGSTAAPPAASSAPSNSSGDAGAGGYSEVPLSRAEEHRSATAESPAAEPQQAATADSSEDGAPARPAASREDSRNTAGADNAAGEPSASSSSRAGPPPERRPSLHSTDDDEDVQAERLDYFFMRVTGAPFHPLFMYYFSCMQMWLLALFAPAAVRLYTGHGYWSALGRTFSERSYGGWLGSLHEGNRLLCASHWLDAANWLV
mmetsp:Transcript_43719/g.72656  ORF Transcript_43719/g.72656 Transcript_43719/m.72656 type:complete len:577 (+) Transcript_43719:97-1827(+)